MKNLPFSIVFIVLSTLAFAEDGTKVIHKSSGDGDSSVLIETTKNPKLIKQDYEIISGEEEVVGDPTAGTKEAYASWKEACKEWKKELKENNSDGKVLISSCGTASFTKDETSGVGSGIYTYKSNAKYKIRVRIKDK
jgi:hypothetical protein